LTSRIKPELVGPLADSPYSDGASAMEQYRRGCRGLRGSKLYKNTAALQKQQVCSLPLSSRPLAADTQGDHRARWYGPSHRSSLAVPFCSCPRQRVVGFYPVRELLDRLQSTFGELALFMVNELHTDVIAVVFRPRAFLPTTFSVMQSRHMLPVRAEAGKGYKSQPLMLPNIPEILMQFRAMGVGVVGEVTVLR
jgi:hypothetical protein